MPACCRIAILVLAAAIVIAPSAVGARQSAGEEMRRDRIAADLKKYHLVLKAYRNSNDDSVKQILDWDLKRLEDAVNAIGTTLDGLPADATDRLKLAAMLHTDAAFHGLDGDWTLLGFHLDLASRLLQRGGPALHPFSSDWYAMVARVLRDRALLFVAEPFLERGRRRLPDDAALLFESAVLQEHIASFAAFDREAPPPHSPVDSRKFPLKAEEYDRSRRVAARRVSLNSAAQWLEASLKLDPSSISTTLHLGRVQMLRGNENDALQLLQRVKASPDVSAAYLAKLFIGAIHERRDQLDAAVATYREAIDRLPTSQSAYIALSQVLQRLGRGDESRDILKRILPKLSDTTMEPWWWYLADRPDDVRWRLDMLRASVRK